MFGQGQLRPLISMRGTYCPDVVGGECRYVVKLIIFVRDVGARNAPPGRAIPVFDEGLGKSAAGGIPNSPDVVAGQGGHAGELAKTMVVSELEGGQQAPGMTIPVLSQGEEVSRSSVSAANHPNIAIRDGGNAVQAPTHGARIKRENGLPGVAGQGAAEKMEREPGQQEASTEDEQQHGERVQKRFSHVFPFDLSFTSTTVQSVRSTSLAQARLGHVPRPRARPGHWGARRDC